MDKRASVIFNVTGQTLDVYPPEGVPSSPATYSVWRSNQADSQSVMFSGTATADPAQANVTDASGYSQANRRRINLDDTADVVVGLKYRIENSDTSQSEVVTVIALGDGFVDAEYDLAYDYGDTYGDAVLYGYRQTLVVDPVFVADQGKINVGADRAYFANQMDQATPLNGNPYKVLWSYTVDGASCKHWTYFDLARHAPQTGLDQADPPYPDAPYQLSPSEFKRYVDKARGRVKADLTFANLDLNTIPEDELMDRLYMDALELEMAEDGIVPSGRSDDKAQYIRERTAKYMRNLESSIAGPFKTTSSTGATTGSADAALMFRS